MKYCIAFLFLVGLLPSTFAQDVILLKDNSKINGKIIEVGTTEIKYKKVENIDGPAYALPKTDVIKIIFKNGYEENLASSDQNLGIAVHDLAIIKNKTIDDAIQFFEQKKFTVKKPYGENAWLIAPPYQTEIRVEGWGFEAGYLYPAKDAVNVDKIIFFKEYPLYEVRRDSDFKDKPYDDTGKKYDIFGNVTHSYPQFKNEVVGNDELSAQHEGKLRQKFVSYFGNPSVLSEYWHYWGAGENCGLYLRRENEVTPVKSWEYYNPVKRKIFLTVGEAKGKVAPAKEKEEFKAKTLFSEYDPGKTSSLSFADFESIRKLYDDTDYVDVVNIISGFLKEKAIYHKVTEINLASFGRTTVIRLGGKRNVRVGDVEFNDGGIAFIKNGGMEILLIKNTPRLLSRTGVNSAPKESDFSEGYSSLLASVKQDGYPISGSNKLSIVKHKNLNSRNPNDYFMQVSLVTNQYDVSSNFQRSLKYLKSGDATDAIGVQYPVLILGFGFIN